MVLVETDELSPSHMSCTPDRRPLTGHLISHGLVGDVKDHMTRIMERMSVKRRVRLDCCQHDPGRAVK